MLDKSVRTQLSVATLIVVAASVAIGADCLKQLDGNCCAHASANYTRECDGIACHDSLTPLDNVLQVKSASSGHKGPIRSAGTTVACCQKIERACSSETNNCYIANIFTITAQPKVITGGACGTGPGDLGLGGDPIYVPLP